MDLNEWVRHQSDVANRSVFLLQSIDLLIDTLKLTRRSRVCVAWAIRSFNLQDLSPLWAELNDNQPKTPRRGLLPVSQPDQVWC